MEGENSIFKWDFFITEIFVAEYYVYIICIGIYV